MSHHDMDMVVLIACGVLLAGVAAVCLASAVWMWRLPDA